VEFRRWTRTWESSKEAYEKHFDKKHKVRASKENPQYLVKSDKTDKLAAHKPGALKKNSKKKSLKKKDYSVLKDNY
jgi:hypothetical protein